jgi:uncharacterized protein YndB with AHSA1/START domain
MTLEPITRQIDIQASPERVWSALTDSQQFGQWFGARISGRFSPGETVQAEMTMEGVEGLAFGMRIAALDAPQRFVFFWPAYDFAEKRDRSDLPWTQVEFQLKPSPTGTLVTVTESGFAALGGAFGARVRAENEDGWAMQCQRLADFIRGQDA